MDVTPEDIDSAERSASPAAGGSSLLAGFRDASSPLYRGQPRWAWGLLAAAVVLLGFDP